MAPLTRSFARPRLLLLASALLTVAACGNKGGSPKGQGQETPVETDCKDGADNDGDGFADCEDLDCRVAGKACELAPPLDRTVATTVWEAAQFLFSGKDPVQKGTSSKRFERKRIAIVRGRVVGRSGEPLGGVKVEVAGQPKWGYTVTRPDGLFDLAVNGGSQLLLSMSRDGFLTAERAVRPDWQSYESAPEVGLVEEGKAVTRVAVDASGEQAAEGDVVEDDFGKRRPVAVFVSGTKATARLPDGSEQALGELHVRLAEYPFERPAADDLDEPARFSAGTAPHAGGLSWGVEATIDEAQALGATTVQFSDPVSLLVENFLGLPVGSPVPLGYYQRGKGDWQPEGAGRVIQIIDVAGDEASVDTDGDGQADDDDTLAALHILHGTRRELARRYSPGDKLWHLSVEHFSPQDIKIPVSAPLTAEAPLAPASVRSIDEPTRHGSLLVERQALSQAFGLGLAGTPYSLRYQSDRTTQFRNGFHIDFPVIGESVPEGLKRVSVKVRIAGQTLRASFDATPAQHATFDWDGKDSFGRTVQGQQRARVTLSYVYDGELRPAETFGSTSQVKIKNADMDGALTVEAALSRRFSLTLGAWDASGYELGGLGLDVLHAFDPGTGKIYFGSGDDRSAENVALVTTRPAGDATLGTPDGVFAAPDGSVIVTEDEEVRGTGGALLRVSPEGEVTPLTGDGAAGDAAGLALGSPQGVAMKADGTILVADFGQNAIRAIAPDGSVSTLVGAGDDALGGAELVASVNDLDGIALGLREELYIIDGQQVLKLEGGAITPFAGTGEAPTTGDVIETEGAPATSVALSTPSGVAVGPDGSVFVSERKGARVRKITPDGLMRTVAGTGVAGFSGDGDRSLSAQLDSPRGLALAADGALYIADQGNNRIRRVTTDGFIQTVVGGGNAKLRDGQLPTQIQLDQPDGIAFGHDGALYIATLSTVYKIAPGLTEISDQQTLVPSEDGHTLWRFDARGKHEATINAVTGVTELSFGYDEETGLLTTIQDKNGLTTTVQRDADGVPGTIVGPFGQRTNLEIIDGVLKSITDPLDRSVKLEYQDDGLLQKVVSPEGAERLFGYTKDGLGLLNKITEPSNYFEEFTSKSVPNGSALEVQTPTGAVSRYTTAQQGDEIRRSFEAADGATTKTTDQRTAVPEFYADGTRVLTNFDADTGFGSQVLIPKDSTLTTPGGRVLETTFQETKRFEDPKNLLSATSWSSAVTDIDGRGSVTDYTRSDRTIRTTSALGRLSTTILDKLGRQTDLEASGFGATHIDYDGFGRVATVTRTAGKETRTQTYGYDDSDGFLRQVTDALNQTTKSEPDIVGRLLGVTTPDGATYAQLFDQDDRLTLVTLPSKKEHHFDYKGASSLLELVTPPPVQGPSPTDLPIGNVRYTYNADNQPTLVERADGNNLEFVYDAAQRLKTLKTSGIALTYGYDKAGRVTSLSRSDGPTLSLGFDGPLLTSCEWRGPVEGKVTADYDKTFRLSQVTVNDASTVSFTYDDDDEIVSATGNQQTLTVDYDSDTGIVASTTLGAVATSYAANAFGEVTDLNAIVKGKQTFSQALERDSLGRITHITENVAAVTTDVDFTYDPAGHLETVARGGVITKYLYDETGNRTSIEVDGVETAAAKYDAQDRIQGHGAFQFEQTENGELLRRSRGNEALELSYDGLGNLLTAVASDAKTAKTVDYTMDGFGRRVGKQIGGKFARAWLYVDALHPVAEITAAGVFTHFVYIGGGAPTFMLRAGVPFRLLKDQLGSVRLVVNATTGAVAQRLDYDEFGRVLVDTAPGFQPFGFAGGLYDADTGLVRFGARDYDAEIGRWVSKDPIGFDGGPNLYAYCGSDPINNVDASGTMISSRIGEDSRLLSNATAWLFQNAGNEFSNGNIGTGLLDGAAGVATGISAILSFPGMEFVGGPMGVITKGEVAAIKVGVAAEIAATKVPVVAGEAGRFATLDARAVVGDALTPHHMPQAALGLTSRAEGGALVMVDSEHALTRTFAGKGAATARSEAGLPFRQVLARDMRDVRRIVGSKYDQGLRDLLTYYKTHFPEKMVR